MKTVDSVDPISKSYPREPQQTRIIFNIQSKLSDCLSQEKRSGYIELLSEMEEALDSSGENESNAHESHQEYIPMKPYNRTNRSRSLPFIRTGTLASALKPTASVKCPSNKPTLKVRQHIIDSI